jgi:predicted nucleic acid-binding protein
VTEVVVLDASAWVDLLLQEPRGERVTRRLADAAIHAPAHIDLELLSAFGRIQRAGGLTAADIDRRLLAAQLMPINRHPLPDLVGGAWGRRDSLRISDAFYVELATRLDAPLITTDLRLARAAPQAEPIT